MSGLVAALLSGVTSIARAEGTLQFFLGGSGGRVLGSEDFDGGGEISAWWVGDHRLVFGADLGLTNRRVYSEAQLAVASAGGTGPALGFSSGVFLGWDGPVGLQSTVWALWSPVPLVPFFRVDWLPDPWSSRTVGVMFKVPAALLGFMFSGRGI